MRLGATVCVATLLLFFARPGKTTQVDKYKYSPFPDTSRHADWRCEFLGRRQAVWSSFPRRDLSIVESKTLTLSDDFKDIFISGTKALPKFLET